MKGGGGCGTNTDSGSACWKKKICIYQKFCNWLLVSLKEIAGIYGVTYPTVILRLDKLIQKIQLTEQKEQEPYVRLIKELAMDDKLDFDTSKLLITAYRKEKGEK